MTTTRSTWWRVLALLLALGLVAAACGDDDGGDSGDGTTTTAAPTDDTEPTDDAGEPQYGGRLVIGLEAEAEGYIPGITATGTSSPSVDRAVFDSLVVVNGDDEFEGYLAESIEANDDLSEWTVVLREGVQFHDDTDFNADALLWNWENLHTAEGSLTAGAITTAGVVSLEKVDDFTVVYKLDGPNAAFPDLLTGRVGMPVSPTAFEAMDEDAFGAAPVGTGPFVAERWTRDDRFTLVRNENYWGTDADGNKLPYLDAIEFRPITDEDSRIQSLLADDVQIIQTTRGESGKRLVEAADEGGFGVNPQKGNIAGASVFNTVVPPIDDIRVRTAMVMASSADDIAAAQGYDGITSPASQFVNSDSPWFSAAAEEAYIGSAGQDLDAAAALLQEYIDDPERSDGKAPGERLSLRYQCPGDPSLLAMSQVLQSVWGEIGIDVELIQVEQAVLIQNVIGVSNGFIGDFDVTCWRVGTNDDPMAYVSNYFGPVEETVTNFANYTNDEITEELVTLREGTSFADRYAALERINVIANEDVVTAWHISYVSTMGWRDDVNGVAEYNLPSGNSGRGNVAGYISSRNLWIEQ